MPQSENVQRRVDIAIMDRVAFAAHPSARRIRRAQPGAMEEALSQLAVANPVRLIGFDAQTPLAVRFVIGVVAFDPHHF